MKRLLPLFILIIVTSQGFTFELQYEETVKRDQREVHIFSNGGAGYFQCGITGNKDFYGRLFFYYLEEGIESWEDADSESFVIYEYNQSDTPMTSPCRAVRVELLRDLKDGKLFTVQEEYNLATDSLDFHIVDENDRTRLL